MESVNLTETKLADFTPEETADKLEIETVDYASLNKESLINLLKAKDQTIENYRTVKENIEKNHTEELEQLNTYYGNRIKELDSLIKYYERKFKILKDFLNIETGGEK